MQSLAQEREGWSARSRVRIHFPTMVRLARQQRPIQRALAVGSVPPELRQVWYRLEAEGVAVQLFERGQLGGREQGVDQALQTAMLRDAFDNNGDPGIAVLLSGDGAGFADGCGFHADLERMHRRGWRIEILAWRHNCNRRMREWAEAKGRFIALDDFYECVTYLEEPQPGQPVAAARAPQPLPPPLHP